MKGPAGRHFGRKIFKVKKIQSPIGATLWLNKSVITQKIPTGFDAPMGILFQHGA